MERQDIEVFLALAHELHFARTAQRLRVAPASISQTIKKLERRFGAPLFTRTTRRVDLTPLGKQLLDELGPAYAQVQAAIVRATATGHGTAGEIHLGYMSAAVARHVLTLVDTFHAGIPDCQVTIRETALANLYGPLRRGEIDLSILPLPVAEPDLTVGPVLLSEAALLAVRTDHRLAQRALVEPADLTDQTFLFAQDLPDYWIEHHLPIARKKDGLELRGPVQFTLLEKPQAFIDVHWCVTCVDPTGSHDSRRHHRNEFHRAKELDISGQAIRIPTG